MDPASSLFDQEQSRAGIPRVHVRLDEGIEPTGGDMGEHQGTRTHVLDRHAGLVQVALQTEVPVERMPRHIPGSDELMIEAVARRNVQARAVGPCAAAARRPEQLVLRRVVDDADATLTGAKEGDRYAPVT